MEAQQDPSARSLADFTLGGWKVQPSLNRLVRGEATAKVEPKLMDVLLLLVRHAGGVVSKDEIAAAVWPEVFISESVITRAIAGLRRAFGDDARSPLYIETIAKRGYRLLIQPATALPASAEAPGSPRPPAEASSAWGPPLAESPFVVGQWVRGERFFGRQAQVREILQGPRNGIWILASRAMGKTSLLKQLEYLTAGDGEGGYFPLFWDLQGSVEPEDLHGDFAAALAETEGRLESVGLSLEEVSAEDVFTSLGRLRRALRARGRTLLLLWDEVEELIHLHRQSPALLRKLRRALQSQEGIRTVLASGPRLWQLSEQRDETSPFLHGFAPPLYLGPLEDEPAAALVRRARGKGNAEAFGDDAFVRELLHRSGNHPSVLQLLCHRVLEKGDLEAATDATAADLTVRYFFAVDFDLLAPLEREILQALGEGAEPQSLKGLGLAAAAPELASRLLHLEGLGQLRHLPDGRWQLASPILARWLREKRSS